MSSKNLDALRNAECAALSGAQLLSPEAAVAAWLPC
jgi:hypothetical protein